MAAKKATYKTIAKHWKNLDPKDLNANRSALLYLRQAAADSNLNLDEVNLIGTFTQEDPSKMVTDRVAINKLIRDLAGKHQLQLKTDVSDDILKGVAKALDRSKAEIALLENSLKSIYADRDLQLNQLVNSATRIYDTTRKIDALKRASEGQSLDPIRSKFETILKAGFWCDPIYDESTHLLWLRTRTNVIMSERSTAAKLDLAADFGQMTVRINVDTFDERVYPRKGGIQLGSNYHPHIDTSGRPCYGSEGSRAVEKARANRDLVQMLTLLQGVLIPVEPGTPFVSLNEFISRGTPIKRLSTNHASPYDRLEKEAKKASEDNDGEDSEDD